MGQEVSRENHKKVRQGMGSEAEGTPCACLWLSMPHQASRIWHSSLLILTHCPFNFSPTSILASITPQPQVTA